jgi:hypothetical protein
MTGHEGVDTSTTGPSHQVMELDGLSGHFVVELNGHARPSSYEAQWPCPALSYQLIVPAIEIYNLMT